MESLRVIISGGGTGGHIFPAVSIANAILEQEPGAEILFVGAEGRMEMQRVPAAGFNIVGLPVRGLLRPLWRLGNVRVLVDFFKSKRMAKDTIRSFKPHVAVGVGGYASSATLNAAYDLGVPLLIQEQNCYAGITNKTLARKADRICVAYEGMERFFPKERILLTGNPVRQGLLNPTLTKTESSAIFQLDPDLPTVLIIGGSLGARTINESVLQNLDLIAQGSVQLIWQTGAHYFEAVRERLAERGGKPKNIFVTDFIARMEQAYKAADVVVSRAGASSLSELCLLGKPSILVPSPNVAEDHQTHNAMALVQRGAALMIKDSEAVGQLIPTAIKLASDKERLKRLGENAYGMAFKDAAKVIAQEVINLARQKERRLADGTKRR
ncbi:MAG: undecaprenyldiphospho-muramoylpentapeptide beta-N-acetylglucosaminyltransferase [Prevotellaceae bacterium]|nr:undecaprenyldiphospho-muramoylpentapeptide beta-N-acetylglucosaminyltransferase [Prevotellaceae bacterium]